MSRIAIITSRFNPQITEPLLQNTLESLPSEETATYFVPGAFEIPLVAKKLAKTNQFDAIICLGAVIRGETPHFDYVCQEVSSGVTKVMLDYEIPVIFGVLTTDTKEQALARIDKGKYCAESALEMIRLLSHLQHSCLAPNARF